MQENEAFPTNFPKLDIQDLQLLRQVVHTAIKRGVYEPNELQTVGLMYGKLDTFIKHQLDVQAANEKQNEDKEK